MAVPTDADLVARIANADERAMGALYDRYAASLVAITLRIMRDRAEAEDVVHDVFITVRARASLYASDRGTVAAWLIVITRNLAIDRARRSSRRRALVRAFVHGSSKDDARPDELHARAKTGDQVRRALATLPPDQQRTLREAFFEGRTYAEVAALERVPLGTVKSRAARAIACLRATLAAVI
jgi:RNA polymerase sigma-70 factor (ECF subfamily)